MNAKELQVLIDVLETEKNNLETEAKKTFEFQLQPEHISTTGLNLFRVAGWKYSYLRTTFQNFRRLAVKLEMCCGQTKAVKFPENSTNNTAVNELKKALKHGDTVYISLNDVILKSYHFNESSGISLYSNGFKIVKIIPRNEGV